MLGAIIGGIASLIGGKNASDSAEKAAAQNAALQREFAQNSIQWKAADAAKAGIHPLYAMGAPTYSATPSYVGDTSFGAGIANAGQDIGRAIDATRTAPQKLEATAATNLELERQKLVNDNLRADLAVKASQTQSTPAFPSAVDPFNIPGQGNSGVSTKALSRIASAHGHPWAEAGPVTDVGFTRTNSGGLAPVYSADAKERLEDDWGGMLAWNVRNRLLPTIGMNSPPPGAAPRGTAWQFNPLRQEYYLVTLK